jgi:hypothetical protein
VREVGLGEAHGLSDGVGFTTCRDTPVLAGLLSPEIGFDDGFPVDSAGGLDVLELGSGVVVSLADGVGVGVPVGDGVTGGVGVPALLGELEDGDDVGCPPDGFAAAGDVAQIGGPEGPGVMPGTATTGSPPVLLVVPEPPLLLPEPPPLPRGEFELLGKKPCGASKAT